jgi:hypothetical protein
MNLNISSVKKSLRLFASSNATKAQRHANVRKHLAALMYLGEKHILAKPVQRKVH